MTKKVYRKQLCLKPLGKKLEAKTKHLAFYIYFLTNLEDEIIFKGGRICNAQNAILEIRKTL